MTEYVDRAARLRAFVEGDTDETGQAAGDTRYLPALTGQTVKADGAARRVAVYDFEVGHRENELVPLNITSVKAGDVALLSQAQADRLEAAGFVMSEADFKVAAGEKKTNRKA